MNNEIFAIRHGESTYSGIEPDLTDKGIEQIKQTALELRNLLEKFDYVIFISSPTPRAVGSAKVFIEEIGRNTKEVHIARGIRTVDIFDEAAFLDFMKKYSTEVYGDFWLKSDILANNTEFCEGRNSINKRANRFLYHYSLFLNKLSEKTGKTYAIVSFTHFEIAVNFLQGLHSENEQFEISKSIPAVQNGEVIRMKIENLEPLTINFNGRGISKTSEFNSKLGRFIPNLQNEG